MLNYLSNIPLARDFEHWQKLFYDDVHSYFAKRNVSRGEVALESWETRFTIFLHKELPPLENKYKQLRSRHNLHTEHFVSPHYLEGFMSQIGNSITSFLEQCIEDARKGNFDEYRVQVNNFPESQENLLEEFLMPKRKSNTNETPTPASIDPEQSVRLLQRQIEEAKKYLSSGSLPENEYAGWNTETNAYLIKAFGSNSPEFNDVMNVGYGVDVPRDAGPEFWEKYHIESLTKKMRILESLVKVLRTDIELQASQPKITTKDDSNRDKKIFIGHGRSHTWRELRDFLKDRLNLDWDEFNRETSAGYPTIARLQQMLDDASFAFIVMTAEDEHSDGKLHARENVIHEAGLFQGRLGFHRAILLVEEGCEEFSNIHGLTQIRFPKGQIESKT